MNQPLGSPTPAAGRTAGFLVRHSGAVVLAAVIVTLLLCVPLLTMGTEQQASADPSGEVFDLRDDIDERFSPAVHGATFLVESTNGDVLTQPELWELYQNEERLRAADRAGNLAPEGLPARPYLYDAFDVDTERPYTGAYSVADAVADVLPTLPGSPTLETASDEEVKLAVHRLLSDPATGGLEGFLSIKATSEPRTLDGETIDYWTSPAMIFNVLADNEKLGGGALEIGVGGGEAVLDKEEFNRNAQEVLRGGQENYRLWGIAIDANLEGAEEGQTAGVFIMFTVIAAVLVAGLSLRSYWAVALTGAGLGALVIWLKGFAALAGLKEGLVIDLIVPIAMISLGVDFALHSLRRYEEEKARGLPPASALGVGMAGVLGALTLAMASGVIAFLSNASSGIEAVIQFGIAAGIAMFAAYVMLGVVLPTAMMRIDRLRTPGDAPHPRWKQTLLVLAGLNVAVLSGTGVIFLVAVSRPLGVAVLLATVTAHIALPLLVMRRRGRSPRKGVSEETPTATAPSGHESGGRFVGLVTGLARYRIVVLPSVLALTAVAAFFATRLEATFDVKDFFASGSDFVVSLDELDEHIGDRGGEPGTIYVEGDLTDPAALAAVDAFMLDIRDDPTIARQPNGDVAVAPTIATLTRRLTESEYALQGVAQSAGVEITDADEDGLPDTQSQLQAAFGYMLEQGVPGDQDVLIYTPGQVAEVLFHAPGTGGPDVTLIQVGIPGSREQQKVVAARESLDGQLTALSDAEPITFVGLTGSPFTRLAQLEATSQTLQRSLPIAAIAALVLLLAAMRSLRYAVVTVIPIGLVVAWLYGLMYVAGFALNYVTATIGAVSIGVGIDYSIHMTERFREEARRTDTGVQALRQATAGTGVALLASALSSIVGFAILALAPMPMFASYGILTALMIFLALAASLAVLPSLLLFVKPDSHGDG